MRQIRNPHPSGAPSIPGQIFTNLSKQGHEDEKENCHWCQLRSFPTHKAAPITVVNEIDSQTLPPNFRFINGVVLGAGVSAADPSFRSGCTCGQDEDCQYSGCLCLADLDQDEASDDSANEHNILDAATGASLSQAGKKAYAYHTHGYKAGLLRSKLHTSKLPLYECHQGCACSPDCPNRVVERGRTVPLQIFRTQDRGWGKLNHPVR